MDKDEPGSEADEELIARLRRAEPAADRPDAFWAAMAERIKADYGAVPRKPVPKPRGRWASLAVPLAVAAGLLVWLQLQPHHPSVVEDAHDESAVFGDGEDDFELEAIDLLDDLESGALERISAEFKKGA